MNADQRTFHPRPSAYFRGCALLALAVACTRPGGGGTERVTVPPQSTFRTVTDTLAARGLIANRLIFRVVARLKGLDRSVKAGVYDLPRGSSMTELLTRLASGKTANARFTAPEGLALPEIAAQAARQLGVPADSVLAAANDTAEINALGVDARSLEGFLLPETYSLPLGSSARDLVRTMARSFEAAWRPEWDARLDTLKLTRLQLVTLASIVEGEARVDEERKVIAGVYHNRLRIGMALQADPTIQYAIMLETGGRKPRLYTKDYRFPSPYNTYLHPGLPPGPVNSPGRRSIEASLYPAKVPFLYFVAMPDGRHRFSATYDEHLRNVAASRRAYRAQE
jgi:peptidoglycan lytic transglycosylase G